MRGKNGCERWLRCCERCDRCGGRNRGGGGAGGGSVPLGEVRYALLLTKKNIKIISYVTIFTVVDTDLTDNGFVKRATFIFVTQIVLKV